MGRFAGLKAAKTFKKGNNITDGAWLLVIKEVKDAGRKKNFWCCEFLILEANQRPHEITGEMAAERRPGDEVSVRWQYNDEYDTTPGKIKSVIEALDADEDYDSWTEEQWDQFAEAMLGPEQPTRGVLIRCDAVTQKQVKDPSKFYTNLNWSPASVDDYARCGDLAATLLRR